MFERRRFITAFFKFDPSIKAYELQSDRQVMKMIKTGTVLQDRYLIEKQIGEGGMGAVYLAIDQRFDNFVAIKVTFFKENEFGEAFEREANLLNGLLHPVLPHVSDYFTEGEEHFLVMQFIEGEDVSDILKREGAFPVKDVLRWTDALLDALDYLHSQEPPIIHRDLKPQNLKLTPRGDVFLLDFGLAKLKQEDTSGVKSVFGYSRKYSPLEQIQGIGTDARSDLFALAATVFHLFTGNPPIDAIARASAIVAGNPDPLRLASEVNAEVPESVANVLNSALALNAENRFISANAMRQALKFAVQGTSWEHSEAFPEAKLVAVGTEPKVINPVEDTDFPALAAFAETVETPAETIETDNLQTIEIDKTNTEELAAPENQVYASAAAPVAAAAVLQKNAGGDIPTQVARRAPKSRFSLAALAALLVIIVATVSGFFIFKNRNGAEPDRTPTEIGVAETDSSSEQPEAVSDKTEQQAAISDSLAAENTEKIPAKPVPAKNGKPEIENAPVIEEIRENPNPKPAKPENKQPAAKTKNSDIDRRVRIVRTEKVPDIESVFTGRPSWEREERLRRREERRLRIEGMSEEEFREMRRRRRQQRRQNNYPIPF
jgi:serine/threonine protein kinase